MAEVAQGVFNQQKNTMAYGNGGSRTRNMTKRRRGKKGSKKLATVSTVRRMLSGVQEKKQSCQTIQASGSTNMNSGVLTGYNLTAAITQGTADGMRVGDSIDLTAFVANVRWTTNAAAGFYQLRVLLFYSGEEVNPAAFQTTGFLTTSQVITPASLFAVVGVINTKAVTILYDNLLELNSTISTVQEGVTARINVPLKGKFHYNETAGVYGKSKNLYIAVIPQYTGPGTPTDNGICSINYALKYSDS